MTFWFAPLLQAVYAFQKAAILSMLPEKEVTALGENVVELFRWITENRCWLAKCTRYSRSCDMFLAGRWMVSGWGLLGNRFLQRSLRQRRRSATILPPLPNYLSLLWWENAFSLVLILWMICTKIKHLSFISSGNDVRLEWFHRGWQKTQFDPKHFGHVRGSG